MNARTDIDLSTAASTGIGADVERRWQRVAVDPVSLQVIGGALRAIAHEMAEHLFRMAYSSIMRESRDIGAGLLDFHGRQLCESDSTPMHCGSLPAYVRGVDRVHRGRYAEGDVILHNHPYHGASHSPDYGVLVPIFHGGEHVGFAGCTGHMVDIGAANPGFSVDVPDYYAEGQLIDAIKIYQDGHRQDAVWSLIMTNVRTPEANAGDLEAMIACCRLGARRLGELFDRYGIDTVMSAAEEWMDYAERVLRARIEELPDGVYEAPEGWLEDDGKNFGQPLRIATRVVVQGSDVYVDLTGSNDEVETGFNCPFEGSVLPTANFAVRSLLLDEAGAGRDVPQNDGVFRPVHVIAPPGSLFNPRPPRGCEARFTQINRIPDQVMQALAGALPREVTAGCSANVSCFAYSGQGGQGSDEYWVNIEVNEGSYGGRHGRDGLDAIDTLMANTRNNPIEEMELNAPLVCERYELRDEPPAPGQWRGGLGAVRRWRFLRDTGASSTGDNRSIDPPRGLFGGHDGRAGAVIVNPGTGEAQELPAKISNHRFRAGDRLEVRLVSGAGYGDPFRRDPRAVLNDVLDGLLSAADAERDYGVVLSADGRQVDPAATERARASR
ncbi:MAG: hydantoinase B/oxoprolinase family protein [Xanthomonadales bacterium]|nr:hydantoinase B/oxoprolinase family protein [Xanthomonadales bacterium]NIN59232.1 hydantoinase B/oxoprolinase family protein [Xanthomonadales bacterium]NIN74583.1 hydantoinase B/oxoprolinase family protein [Xanthomonadales bacterium]NIO12530.1 hydantoinase B/oxoprolinase family protein [Xanthomonadales bacterium]NIP11625.1 hydantoinase B/oxoprolinase family protein [Xanthomonadales bacterium]